MVTWLVSKGLLVVGVVAWFASGEPWLSLALVGGVVTCLVGSGVLVAGVVALFASGGLGWAERWLGLGSPTWSSNVCLWLWLWLGLEPWLSSWITFSCIAVQFWRFETAVHENVSKTTPKSSRFRA